MSPLRAIASLNNRVDIHYDTWYKYRLKHKDNIVTDKKAEPYTFEPHSPAFHIPSGTEVVVLESDDIVAKVIDVEDSLPRPFNVRTQDLEAI